MKVNMKPNHRDMDVYEILNELEKLQSTTNKIEYLQTNFRDHKPLQYMIMMNFSSAVQSVFPEGPAPVEMKELDGPSRSSLWQYLQVMPVFVVSQQSQKMQALKRENMFIEMLQSLDPREAELVNLAKDRLLTTKWNISAELFNSAFAWGLDLKIGADVEVPEVYVQPPEEVLELKLSRLEEIRTLVDQLKEDDKLLVKEIKALEAEIKAKAKSK